jgi:uncharacterized membrane protein
MAVVVIGPEGHRVPSVLRTRTAKTLAAALAGGELVLDKYSGTPDRTEAPSVALRVALGAGSAGLLARSEQEPPGPAATLGAFAALGATFGGFAARRHFSARYPALSVALVEDGVACALAALAVTWFAGPSPTP